MKRRTLLALLATAVALRPGTPAAQQKTVPVIGFLGGFAPSAKAEIDLELAAFREGLREMGFVEGRNVAIVYRKGEGHLDRLPALAADLVSHNVDVIVTQGGDAACFAAQNATSTIPIVFHTTSDPIATGMVSSLARPGGNLTGVAYLTVQLMPKLLELLLEQVPQGRVFGLLVSLKFAEAGRVIGAVQKAARAKRVKVRILDAHTASEVESAFMTLHRINADGLVVYNAFRPQIAALALHYRVPAIAAPRDFADVGGLLSYGASIPAIYHLKGIYTGKILKGAKPADLPVEQPTKFELVINLKTAKALGLTVPQSLLARADEVIE
jgi:ABC-type uncharacterized transport system substrate-binding protein